MTTEPTNPGGDEPIVEAPEVETEAVEVEAQEQEFDDEGNPVEQPEPEDDETEELDLNGKKVRIPKEVKPLVLMQADYTRKTQELAEQRRALDAERAQQAETFQALREDHVKVGLIETQVAQFENVDWQAWFAQDPSAAQAGSFQYQQLQNALQKAAADLKTKEEAHVQQARATAESHLNKLGVELADPVKGIPGFGAEVANQIVEYAAKELGLSVDEMKQSDARAWKAVHRLQKAEAELATLKAKQTKAQHHEKAQQAQPAVRTKGSFAPAGLHDNLPPEEWVRRRNAQLAKRS